MKPKRSAWISFCVIGWQLLMAMAAHPAEASNAPSTPTKIRQTIPWNQIGAKAGADYHGDGLSVKPSQAGAKLHCIFQRMDGEATEQGLWLVSTVTNLPNDRFQVMATAIGNRPLPPQGKVTAEGKTVRFTRPGLVEEYSVSMDGVEQDFVVAEKPAGNKELKVPLAVSGARVELADYGAQLVLEKSGRVIAYSRLRVTDAKGKVLPAHLEAGQNAEKLIVVVNDANAVYPVRIDPTFNDANWVSMGGLPGTDGQIDAAVIDGAGNLYIGGTFTIVGNIIGNNIAEWNGSSWLSLGSGISGSYASVNSLAISGGTLYAGGNFTMAGSASANCIAQWNGSSWSELGSGLGGLSPTVYALAVSGGTLYAAGNFTTAGSMAAKNIAQWNGSSWSPLGSGINNIVYALEASSGTLYAGGQFSSAGGVSANNIAQWNGSSWSPLGSGIGGFVSALTVSSGGTLYVGGDFTTAGGAAANSIAEWNGSNWSSLGSGIGGVVSALTVSSGGTLYVGGGFTTAGGIAANNMAQWNGSSWSPLGSGINGSVGALVVADGLLYAYGYFTNAVDYVSQSIMQWNGSGWSAPAFGAIRLGMNSQVHALSVSGGTVYVSGDFSMAGDVPANFIAQWNGNVWSALGSGIGGSFLSVNALAVSGTNLYAGGYFTMAGGVPANDIAQWNGSSWSALGAGMNGQVLALAVSGTNLFAGGYFTTAGGVSANSIAQWNGSSWSALGLGIGGSFLSVDALAVSGTNLYVGGSFSTAGGASAKYIAQWDGSSWSALGVGMNGQVNALTVSGTNLYAGGYFSTAGGVSANSIAQWNGSSWSPLGSGIGGGVDALAVSGTNLYAGGSFSTAGGVSADNIAQWNGSSWSALGSGVGGTYPSVNSLAVWEGNVIAGGDFTTAGTNASAYFAEAVLQPGPFITANLTSQTVTAGSNVTFNVAAIGAPPLSYQWYFDGSAILNATNDPLTLTNLIESQAGNYSLVITNIYGSATSSVAYLTVTLPRTGGYLFDDTFDPTIASGFVNYYGGDSINGSDGVVAGVGVNSSAAFQIQSSFIGLNGYGYYAGQWQDDVVSANTDTNLGDYVLSFDARVSGDAVHQNGGGFVLQIQEGAGQYFSTPFPQGQLVTYQPYQGGADLLVTQDGGWQHFAINLGGNTFKLPDGTNLTFNPTGGTWQINFQINSGDWGAEPQTNSTLVIDNLALNLIVPPAAASAPMRNHDGSMTLNLLTSPDISSRLYWTTNLIPPVVWQPIYTNPLGGSWQFTDTNTAGIRAKFYHASTP